MEKKGKKSIVIGITSLFLIMLVLLGLTYAYYRTRIIGNTSNKPSISVESKKMEVVYADGSATFSTNDANALIEPGFTYTKTFYVRNTGSEDVVYSVILDEMNNTYVRNQDWKVTLTKNGASVISDTDNVNLAVGTHQVLLGSETILAPTEDAESKDTYVLTITYKNLTDIDQSEDMNKKLEFKVNIAEETYLWGDAPQGSLLYALKSNNTVKDTLTKPGREASKSEEALLSTTEDDYGTSYYFRGAVTNNFVNYSGMCWRIVRIQGDGTIKLVLADEYNECSANVEANADGSFSGYSTENGTSGVIFLGYKEPSYREEVGEGWQRWSSLYKQTKNIVGENYKTLTYESGSVPMYLNKWATKQITNAEGDVVREQNLDTTKLVEAEFCNDLSLNVYNESDMNSNYGGYNRLRHTATANPTLKCNQIGLIDNTKAIRVRSTIGVLTADEVVYSGSIWGAGSSTYLKTNVTSMGDPNAPKRDGVENEHKDLAGFWTMTPSGGNIAGNNMNENGYYQYIWIMKADGQIYSYKNFFSAYIRPAITLKSNVMASGLGTQENPYVIR